MGGRSASGTVRDLLGLPFLLFLLLPLGALAFHVRSAQFIADLSSDEARQAIWLSLRTTVVAIVLLVLLGTPLALAVSRGRFPMKGVVDAFIDLPLVLPPAAAGVGLLLAYGRMGLGQYLERFGITVAFSPLAVVIAQLFVASPYFIRTAAGAFSAVDRELEAQASVDGATASQAFWRITVPITRLQLVGGILMAWARAVGEFGATILFAGNLVGRTQTIPLAIYLGFESNLDQAISLAVLLLLLAFVILVAARLLLRPSST